MRWLFPLLTILLVLTGCSGTPTPEFTPEEIIFRSAERMKSISGFELLFDRSGASAYLDYEETLSLSKMEGHYDAPDKVRATVRVIAPGFVVDVDVITVGRTQWQTNVFTGEWEQLPEDWGFNPSTLFDPEFGLGAILTADLSDVELLGLEELEEMPGKKLYTISAVLAGENIFDLSNWLIGPDDMDAKIYIDPDTFDLHRTILTEHQGDEELERIWTIDFWNFDTVENIEPPETNTD
ncbi:MAG: LppX_LprAFG lipoprotein [Anaerolineaceae bacterium]|nr:LppX_LprAFG lipoprotein [Anaerolineaceae bacterium]